MMHGERAVRSMVMTSSLESARSDDSGETLMSSSLRSVAD